MGTWIDVPVQDIIGFFTDTIGYFTMVALKMGKVIALLGVAWSLIQMAFGTMDGRKVFVGMMTKFMLFFVIMTFYPSMTAGLRKFAVSLGKEASPMALDTVTNSLASYMKSLQRIINEEDGDLNNAIAEKEKLISQIKEEHSAKSTYWDNADRLTAQYYSAERELEQLKKQKDKINENTAGLRRKIEAISTVLKTDAGTDMTAKYALDLDMKDSAGKSRGYISPNALLRMTTLAADIMRENEWMNDVMLNAYYSEKEQSKMSDEDMAKFEREVRLGKKKLTILNLPLSALDRYVLVLGCCLFMILTSIGCMGQYIMAIVEYFITSSVGSVIVPCMLFDGLNDMAQRVLPMLFAQALKLTMITMCMMFNVFTYLKMTMTVVENNAAFGLTQLVYVIFTSFLTFVLTVNAPKLATTILTGQPQMSLGEFMQAAGAIVAGTAVASHGAQMAGNVSAGVARFGANRLGDGAAMLGAAKRGWDAEGGGAKGLAHAGLSAMGEGASRTGKRVRAAASNFVHTGRVGGGSGRGFGGGGSGGGTADIMSAGNQAAVNAKNQVGHNTYGGLNVYDANGNKIDDERQNPTAIGAMNYADARTNSGNYMSFGDYLKTQFNTAAGKETSPYRYHLNKDGIPVVDAPKKKAPLFLNGTWYEDGKPVPPPPHARGKRT